MDSAVFIALLSFAGTLIGTFAGILTSTKLTEFRLKKLEEKVEKHNSVVERTFIVENDVKHIYHEIDDIKQEIHSPKTA